MKKYRPARELAGEVERTLASNQPSFQDSPLEHVIEILCQGRHYSWMGIYLAVGEASQQLLQSTQDPHIGQVTSPKTRCKILVSMKLAGREVGVLAVESERERAFGAEDRVLLEQVAAILARFLAGPGRYLVRKARQQATATPHPQPQARGPQSESASRTTVRSAAVGEK